MRRPSTILLALFAVSGAAGAETVVPAGTYAAATWTEAGSPYRVAGDVTFESLVIEAGTEVRVATADPLLRIVVDSLNVDGTPDRPVTFKAETPGEDQRWQGLRVVGTSELTFARLQNTVIALFATLSPEETVTVIGSVFDRPGQSGLESSGGGVLHVDRSFFSGGNGILASGGCSVFVDNSVFVDSGLDAVGCLSGASCSVRNSTFDGNQFGVFSSGSNVDVESCIFTNNDHAVQGFFEVSHSAFWANATDLEGEITQGDGNLFADPRYVAPGDFHLSSDSPCIDGGADNGPAHDFEGRARPVAVSNGAGQGFDMGAYEFDPLGDGGTGGAPGGGASGGVAGAAGEGTGGGEGGVGGDNGASGGSLGAGSGGTNTGAGGGGSGGGGTTSAGGEGSGAVGGAAPGGTGATSGAGVEDAARTSRGCGCRQPGTPSAPAGWLIALLGVAVVAARRKQSGGH